MSTFILCVGKKMKFSLVSPTLQKYNRRVQKVEVLN